MVVVSNGLCDHLTGSQKEAVRVDFDVSGNASHGLIGFNHINIDGRPFTDSAPGGASFFEQHDLTVPKRRHPLSRSFK